MFKEFKTFLMRGNVVDLAVGVIVGAAFGKIVSSLVTDILMPPLGLLIGGIDFSSMTFSLKPASGSAKAVVINYGLFLNNVVDFLIVAFCIFLIIKAVNTLKSEPPPAEPTEKKCPLCCMLIPVEAKKCGHCTSIL